MNAHNIPIFNVKQSFFKNSFFSSTISEWNKLDSGIPNSESSSVFRKNILHFIRPVPNYIYNCNNPEGVKLITRLNPLCNCGHDIEFTTHFLLHCLLFVNERSTFFSTLISLDCNQLDNTDSTLTQTLLFGNTSFKSNENLKNLIATIDYILSTKRSDELLF